MGRDIAGRKDRDGRMGGCEAQIVGGVTSLRFGGQLLLLLLLLARTCGGVAAARRRVIDRAWLAPRPVGPRRTTRQPPRPKLINKLSLPG